VPAVVSAEPAVAEDALEEDGVIMTPVNGAAAEAAPEPAAAASAPPSAGEGEREVEGDVEGARLVALNMALNGTSREETDRYLAENFHLSDRTSLLDEVYATVES
jgi:hypothetical protein